MASRCCTGQAPTAACCATTSLPELPPPPLPPQGGPSPGYSFVPACRTVRSVGRSWRTPSPSNRGRRHRQETAAGRGRPKPQHHQTSPSRPRTPLSSGAVPVLPPVNKCHVMAATAPGSGQRPRPRGGAWGEDRSQHSSSASRGLGVASRGSCGFPPSPFPWPAAVAPLIGSALILCAGPSGRQAAASPAARQVRPPPPTMHS